MFKQILFILLVFCQSSFAQIINDLPGQQIKKAVLFTGTNSIIPTHKGLIESLPDVKFLVLVNSELNYKEVKLQYLYKNVEIKHLDYPITSWSQDRMLRMQDSISGVLSEHTAELLSIYETVAVKEASSILNLNNDSNSSDYWISRYTGKDPFIIKTPTPNYLPSNQSDLFFGDGGDRLVADNYMFFGGQSLLNMRKMKNDIKIEQLTNKKLIEIDTEQFNRYAFHLDTYLTLVGNKEIIFGSYQEGLNTLPKGLGWVDYALMNKKSKLESKIIQSFKDLGFNITLIPLVYKKDIGLIGFNNGVFNLKTFYLSDYKFKDEGIDLWVSVIKEKTKEQYSKKGITLKFIPGGENNISLGGQVRCTMAVISTY